MGNVIFTQKEIDTHIKHLTEKIQEERKLGYNLRNSSYMRYLARNLKSWQEAKTKQETVTQDNINGIQKRTKLTNKRHKNCGAGTAPVELIEYTDGAIAFSEHDCDEAFIYLYPEQIEQLHLRLIERLREKELTLLAEELKNETEDD